jgi:hypothetical protein
MDITSARAALSSTTRKGVGLPLAGSVYWIVASVLFLLLPPKRAELLVMIGTGAIFPLGLLLSKLAHGDVMAKQPPLSNLGVVLAAVQLFYWPVLILCFVQLPLWFPFVAVVLFGSHFLPYGWLYQSPGYYFMGIALPIAATVLALFGSSISYRWTAPVAAGIYLLGFIQILREIKPKI